MGKVKIVEKRLFKVKKIGNSKGIIIDKDITELLKIEVDDWVEITIKKAKIPNNNDLK